jgi:hypothetical protein
MRAVDKFILHVVHNLYPLNEYSVGEMKFLTDKFRQEADDLNITVSDEQLKAYIERFDTLKNSPKVTDKDLRKYSLSKLIKLVTSSKGVSEPEDAADVTPDIVYNENGLIIYNGSKEDNCLTYGRNESWCITRGSFGNYRYDDSRKNPTFYLVKDTNLPDSDRKSFFVVVVGKDDTYKVSDRSNNDVGGRGTEWDRWESFSFVEQNFPSINGLRSIFKYIPLSSKEKLNQNYKSQPATFREWVKLPYSVKEQYLVVRKGRDLFKDIDNIEFVKDYLPKYPQIAAFISTNFGIIPSETLVKYLDKFSNQDVKSIIANMRDTIDLKLLSSEVISFEVKKFLVTSNKWNVPKDARLYIVKDNSAIVKLTLGEEISVGVYTEDDDFPNIKLNKRTSKYLVDYPELDKIPFNLMMKLASDEVIDKNLIDKIITQAEADPNSALIVKSVESGKVLLDTNSFVSYKIIGDKFEKIPFDSEEIQNVFKENTENESLQTNALAFLSSNVQIPLTVEKDAFVSVLKAIPNDRRIIPQERNSPPLAVILTNDENAFIIAIPTDSITNLRAKTYGVNNWRRGGSGGEPINSIEAWSAYFGYLRSQNKAYDTNTLIRTLKTDGYNTGRAKIAFLSSVPPLTTDNQYRVVMNGDEPLVLNVRSPRESFKVSSNSGKLVKANVPASLAARLLGTTPAVQGAGGAAAPTRRGRPAGQPNTPAQPVAAAAAGDLNVAVEMGDIGLEAAFLRLPRPIFRRLNVDNASRVDPNGDRGASRRNNQLGNRGRVGRIISLPSGSKIYIIRLANQQVIASINIQPGNSNYILTGNDNGNVAIPLNSPADLLSVLQQRGLAEAHQYIVNEYLENNPSHIVEFKKLLRKHLNK